MMNEIETLHAEIVEKDATIKLIMKALANE